jgi:hypothetical protein
VPLASDHVSIGGWQVAQSKIEQGIEHSKKARTAQFEIDTAQLALLPQAAGEAINVVKFLKWVARGNRYIHTYARVGDYDFHGIPANPQTGEPKDFMDWENSILRVVVMKSYVTERIWEMLDGIQLPFCSLYVDPRLTPQAICARFLDIGMAFGSGAGPGRQCITYEADNWHEIFPWLASPVNSNTVTATLFKSIGARGMNGETSLQDIYRNYKIPGADHSLLEKLRSSIGSWFWNRVQGGERRLDALVDEYQQKWNTPSVPGKPMVAHTAAPSPIVG